MQDANRPILVTGAQRSGTTWVGRTVAQHRGVRYVHEPFNVAQPNPIAGLELHTWMTHFESSPRQAEIMHSFDNLLGASPVRYALARSRAVGLDFKSPLRFLKDLILETVFQPRILVKDPIALLSAGWLHETYQFQVICMLRNPYGFVGSMKSAGWDFEFQDLYRQERLMSGWLKRFADRIEYMCEHRNSSDLIARLALLWNILNSVILRYMRDYPDWLFIRHESIAKRPLRGFQRIFDYLGLDMTPRIRKYIQHYTSIRDPRIPATPTYRPRNSRRVTQNWKDRLTRRETERVRDMTSEIASVLSSTEAWDSLG